MHTTFRILFFVFLCFSLVVLSGCGVSLTPAEKAEIDPYIKNHGRDSLQEYLKHERYSRSHTDENLALKYVKYLVSQGADVNAGHPLAMAIETGYVKVTKFLISKGANATDGLYAAVKNKDLEVVKFLVSKGADVNSGLDSAARIGDASMLEFFVSKGANINANRSRLVIGDSGTALHVAAGAGNLDAVIFFVSQGANVNERESHHGFSPLHVVTFMYSESGKHLEVIKFLVSKGADVNAKDQKGRTPLDVAKEKRYPKIIEYLSGLK